ncbi:hypothetical protein GCM10008944_18590 [Cytobacillus oceanisediminis]
MSVAALDTHPVPSCVRTARESFSSVPTSAWDGLETGEVRRLIGELGRLESQVATHKMAAARVLENARKAAAGGDGPRPGTGTSTGATISFDFGGDRSGADALVNTAERCEETLLRDAQKLSLKDLRRRGDRITEAYRKKTDEVAADEDAILRRKEEAARAKTSFSMWDNNDGTLTGRFTLPEAQGAMLKTALDALSAPHQKVGTVNAATGEHDEIGFGQAYPQRLGHAFATLIEHIPADSLPSNGGVSAVVTVNLDLDTLMGGIKAAGLSDGTRIFAEEARHLACTAKIAPFVLDGKSLPIDFGTSNRYFNAASRRALEKRDMGCTTPGCDRDARWCEAHHMHPYSITGRTDIRDGALLCSFHHHRAHDQGWIGRINPDNGHVEWKLPVSDTWQRNQRWRP